MCGISVSVSVSVSLKGEEYSVLCAKLCSRAQAILQRFLRVC